MVEAPKFQIGEDVFVRDPQKYEAGCTCVVGPVKGISWNQVANAYDYVIQASIGRPWPDRGEELDLTFPEAMIQHRPGTPLSRLSGRPGHEGYAEFKRIAATYGYD